MRAEQDITYSTRPDVKPEDELNALAACYRIILEKEAAPEAAPTMRKDPKNDRTATEIIPKPS